jgi:ABC-type branched-subunit amino acid transport system substrate-binding protein
MSLNPHFRRRTLLSALAASAIGPGVVWSQPPKQAPGGAAATLVQIADFSAAQIDISKDFVLGTRVALQEFNLKGGLHGKSLQHQVIEVDSSPASVKAAVQTIRTNSHIVTVMGTVASAAAAQVTDLLSSELPDVAHVAPWLQTSRSEIGDNTFSIFASRQEQIAFALKSLVAIGVQEIGAIYATPAEFSNYRGDVAQVAKSLHLGCKHLGPVADLQQLGRSLASGSPRILIFLGGTPELAQFTQGIDKQATQRYIVAMSDVNLQTLQQLGFSRHAPVIATQVVPLMNTGVPLVKNFSAVLGRLFDEPPTPHSLAGFVAAKYCIAVLQSTDGNLTRGNVLTAFQQRTAIELGGFKADPDPRRRGASFVTQSMMAMDGRLVG